MFYYYQDGKCWDASLIFSKKGEMSNQKYLHTCYNLAIGLHDIHKMNSDCNEIYSSILCMLISRCIATSDNQSVDIGGYFIVVEVVDRELKVEEVNLLYPLLGSNNRASHSWAINSNIF